MMVLESCLTTQSLVNREVQEGTKHAPLSGPRVEDQLGICVVTYPCHLGATRQEAQDLVTEGVDFKKECKRGREKERESKRERR